MINTPSASDSYDVGPAVIRALSSLTHDNADKIAQAVEAGAPDWEVDRVDDPDGYVAVFVSLKDDMDAQPTYWLSGTVQRVEVSEVHGDTLRELGPFDSLEQAVDALLLSLKPAPRQ
jgi:hypothetical protein